MAEDNIRTFIAVKLPRAIQEKIGTLQDKFKNPQDKITWTNPYNIHITLKFLGDIISSRIAHIEKIISDTARNYRSFEISIYGIGTFPKIGQPHIIWAGIRNGKDELNNLYTAVIDNLKKIGYSKQKREFTPHLTLGRIKHIGNTGNFMRRVYKHKEDILANLVVNDILLLKSTLTLKGPIYKTLYKARLAGQGSKSQNQL